MRIVLFIYFFSFVSFLSAQDTLQLITIKQIEKEAYELSGFTIHPTKGILCIEDEHSYLSQLDTTTWKLHNLQKIRIKNVHTDFEGIDVLNQDIYVLDEKTSTVYKVAHKKVQAIKVNYKDWESQNNTNLYISKWGNAGYEGLAFNSDDSILYLIKERKAKQVNDRRFILEVDLKTGNILKRIDILPKGRNTDFADGKFIKKDSNEYLYLIERNNYSILRYNLKTGEEKRLSFKKYLCDKDGDLNMYFSEHPEYGIAEALIIFKDEIWIGLDNNQIAVNPKQKYVKKYHLHGTAPSILIFKRPKDF